MHGREVALQLEKPYFLNSETPTKKYEMRQDVKWDQSHSKQRAYKVQFFMDLKSMPKPKPMNSEQINDSYLEKMLDIDGKQLYNNLKKGKNE